MASLAALATRNLTTRLAEDLDGGAGLGIAAHAGGAVFEDKLADSWQREGVFGVLVGERGNMIQNFRRLFLWDFRLVGDGGDEL